MLGRRCVIWSALDEAQPLGGRRGIYSDPWNSADPAAEGTHARSYTANIPAALFPAAVRSLRRKRVFFLLCPRVVSAGPTTNTEINANPPPLNQNPHTALPSTPTHKRQPSRIRSDGTTSSRFRTATP